MLLAGIVGSSGVVMVAPAFVQVSMQEQHHVENIESGTTRRAQVHHEEATTAAS